MFMRRTVPALQTTRAERRVRFLSDREVLTPVGLIFVVVSAFVVAAMFLYSLSLEVL